MSSSVVISCKEPFGSSIFNVWFGTGLLIWQI